MALLNQIIAVEKGVRSRSYGKVTDLHGITKKADLFSGFAKVYKPKDEEGETLPEEKKLVQFNAWDVLEEATDALGELIDITARKDFTNTIAFADVVVDGAVLIEKAPVPFLLFLEKQLQDIYTFVANLPVLDETVEWDMDENSGLYRSDKVQTHRTKKLNRPLVLYPATERHPAQTQMVTEDIIVGFWEATKFSGAMRKPDKDQLLERAETLLQAVKQAREAANVTEEKHISPPSEALFSYLLQN